MMNSEQPNLDALKLPELPMQIQTIREYLPHQYPFLLVDRVTSIENMTKIQGYKNLTMNEEFFQGHFPHYPIMPGVLIMEALAQLSGILGMIILQQKPEDGDTFLFAGMEHVRFKKQVVPGDQLILNSELILNRRGVFKFHATACVDDKIVAQAEIILSRQTLPS
ncbi:3-hydroxyacyl-[acyl-carrier-protein] dehydratase FabZ [Acinetobacter populi]|uniref:3-hydroxyacyl-[acyl-carrier-protein] dehydratase FabZ n=2 Tax=Acinetobacter populi TaxID=1582270 RepID=A0A1Z9YUX3_9GAMM|nr:3-hydroxyacyl-[acyl-carrier-protein] dehydratase FabZ [Acinetobacter populi]